MSELDKTKSPSYKSCSCGGECYCGTEQEPCWGQVEAADEEETIDKDGNRDFYWIHACEGHYDYVSWRYDENHKYVPEPKFLPDSSNV